MDATVTLKMNPAELNTLRHALRVAQAEAAELVSNREAPNSERQGARQRQVEIRELRERLA